MKIKILSICLIVLGAVVILNSTRTIVGSLITSKELSCEGIKHQIKDGFYSNTIDINKVYNEKRLSGLRNSIIQFGFGLILLVLGIFLINKQNSRTLSLRSKVFEIGVNLLYWLFLTLLLGYWLSGGGQRFTSCTVDWLYIYLTSGLIGFYSSYFLVYRIDRKRSWISTLGFGLLYSFIGCIVSYSDSSIFLYGFKCLLNIQLYLAFGFFAFFSIVHFYLGLLAKSLIMKNR